MRDRREVSDVPCSSYVGGGTIRLAKEQLIGQGSVRHVPGRYSILLRRSVQSVSVQHLGTLGNRSDGGCHVHDRLDLAGAGSGVPIEERRPEFQLVPQLGDNLDHNPTRKF